MTQEAYKYTESYIKIINILYIDMALTTTLPMNLKQRFLYTVGLKSH